ncbi:MAG: VWA domain-containing protein [Thermonemataceae bacterium]
MTDKLNLVFPHSPLYILLCILVGAAYAFLLYQKKAPWSKTLNYVLAGIRFVFVTLICFLLLAPVVRSVQNTLEKPSLVFAIDNSQSLALMKDTASLQQLTQRLAAIGDKLEKKGVAVEMTSFNTQEALAQLRFTHESSNLSQLLNTIGNNYENRNLDKVVLVSDGIHNQGISPIYQKYNFPVWTVGLGDTTLKKDLKVKAVFVNKIAYLGNQFPVVAEIQNIGFSDRPLRVSLLQGAAVVQQKTINVKRNDLAEVEFLSTAKVKGTQRYTVVVQTVEGEVTTLNNSRDVFVEVVDGREKILMMGYAPHPDFKAFKQIIEQNNNYSFEAHFLGLGTPKEATYDLIIAHQIPDRAGSGNRLLSQYKAKGIPIWYITGSQSNLNAFNTLNDVAQIGGRLGRTDQVTASFNPQFDKLGLADELMQRLQRLPPLQVPYGNYNLKANSEVVLYQKVGNVPTERPLLAIHSDQGTKAAWLAGEGLWHWRLEEYAQHETQEAVDALVLKVVQFLSAKEDKRKLRVYTSDDEYFDYEKVVFEAEAYNDVYEKIYDIKVNLSITNEQNKTYNYTFAISEGSSKFEVSGLPKGVYRYKATAEVLGKMEQAVGEFSVKALQLEALSTTADHQLLRQVAEQTEGQFYPVDQLARLEEQLLDTQKPDKIHSSEELLEIIHFKWLFFLIVGLASVEWVIRKYKGSY